MIHPVLLRGCRLCGGKVEVASMSQSGFCPLTFPGKSREDIELGAPSPLELP